MCITNLVKTLINAHLLLKYPSRNCWIWCAGTLWASELKPRKTRQGGNCDELQLEAFEGQPRTTGATSVGIQVALHRLFISTFSTYYNYNNYRLLRYDISKSLDVRDVGWRQCSSIRRKNAKANRRADGLSGVLAFTELCFCFRRRRVHDILPLQC